MIEKGKTIRRPGCQPAGWKNNKNSKNKQIVWLLRKKQSENWFWQSERGKNSQETGLPASRLEKIVKKTIKTNGLCDCCAKSNQKIDSDSLKGEKQSGDRAASQQVGKNSKNSKNKQIVWLLRKKQSENGFWQSEKGKTVRRPGCQPAGWKK